MRCFAPRHISDAGLTHVIMTPSAKWSFPTGHATAAFPFVAAHALQALPWWAPLFVAAQVIACRAQGRPSPCVWEAGSDRVSTALSQAYCSKVQAMNFAQLFPSMLTALLASLVECIEALTVILAVGAVFGWRDALIGAGVALFAVLLAAIIFGPALSLVPATAIHLVFGLLLFAFGFRWLRKAVRRAAGVIPLRDEVVAYKRHSNRLRGLSTNAKANRPDRTGMATAFQITAIEGSEVIFIILAIGAADRRLLAPAGFGAAFALALVVALGVILHRPLARLPENTIKFAVGVLTCAFGLFWFGNGLGIHWPGEDWAVLWLATAVLVTATIAVLVSTAKG